MNDESLEIIETIRNMRDRALAANGRTAAAMDVMHLSPFEQAIYVDAALNIIDRLTAERDQAREQLAKLRAACKDALGWLDSSGYGEDHDAITAIEAAARIRAVLGIEVSE